MSLMEMIDSNGGTFMKISFRTPLLFAICSLVINVKKKKRERKISFINESQMNLERIRGVLPTAAASLLI